MTDRVEVALRIGLFILGCLLLLEYMQLVIGIVAIWLAISLK